MAVHLNYARYNPPRILDIDPLFPGLSATGRPEQLPDAVPFLLILDL